MKFIHSGVLAITLALPASASAQSLLDTVRAEVQAEMAQARTEVRADMEEERRKLREDNLALGKGLPASTRRGDVRNSVSLPAAHITPAGDLVIGQTAVAVSDAQRAELLAYRGQVVAIAIDGINAGEKAAMAALEITDAPVMALLAGAFTGRLARRVETTVKQHLEPMVLQICQQLPPLHASQQALSASVPEFAPYADLDADEVTGCETDMRHQLALR